MPVARVNKFKSSSLQKQIFIFDLPAAGLESVGDREMTMTFGKIIVIHTQHDKNVTLRDKLRYSPKESSRKWKASIPRSSIFVLREEYKF